MWTDPIIEEIRKYRESFAAQFNFDIRAMGKALQEMEKASGRQVVSFTHESVRENLETVGKTTLPKDHGEEKF